MNEDIKWMKIALSQAKKAELLGEVPVGAVLVKDNILIAQAHNQPILSSDPTAHAEVKLLQNAGKIINNYRLIETTLYVTLEPCIMCLGAIMHARVSNIVFGAYDFSSGACGSSVDFTKLNCFNHKVNVTGGILEEDSRNLLHTFFKSKR